MPSSLGQFEQLVMTAILTLGESAYGITIHSKVEELVRPKRVLLGAVYTTLDRLQDKALVASWHSDPRPERGGRSKRHYRLRDSGERALHESAITAKRICEVVEETWGGNVWSPTPRKWKFSRQHFNWFGLGAMCRKFEAPIRFACDLTVKEFGPSGG